MITHEEIFSMDKSTWFIEGDNGIRIWNVNLVSTFWSLLKAHKIDKGDFNFENIVFPSCSAGITEQLSHSENYYVEIFSHLKNINNTVIFKNCRFQGSLNFLGNIAGVTDFPKADITFLKDLRFENCNFEKEFRLQGQKIKGSLYINSCNFFSESYIIMSMFFARIGINNNNFNDKFLYFHNRNAGNVNISSNIFEKHFQLGENTFSSQFSISTAEFNGNVSIYSNTYVTYGSFANIHFNSQSSIKNEVYDNFQFQDLFFSSKNHLFEEIKFSNKGILTIRNQVFPESVIMRNCDCSKMRFLNCDISEVKFSSCNWNLSDRIITLNENEFNKEEIVDIQKLENLYRQLKRNFENDKDWEMAGKAYVSEMKFRQLRLKLEKNYFSFFIYWFYDFFGGYTQNYTKPIIWFVAFTFLIFPQYYFLYENHNGLRDVYIKSIAASSPWLQTTLNYENWGILAIQKTFSAILLTFIILALRKRFKE